MFDVELSCAGVMECSTELINLERGSSNTVSQYVLLRTFGTQIRATVHVPTGGEYRLELYGERRALLATANGRGTLPLLWRYLLVAGNQVSGSGEGRMGPGSILNSITSGMDVGSSHASALEAHEKRCYGATDKMEKCEMHPLGVAANDPLIRTQDAEFTLRFGFERPLTVLHSLDYYSDDNPACKMEQKEYVLSQLLRNDKQVLIIFWKKF